MSNIWNSILTIFMQHGMIIELAVSISMFTWWLPKRAHFALRAICGLSVLIAVSIVWDSFVPAFPWLAMIRFMVFLGIFFLVIWGCWNTTVQHVLLYLVAGGVMQHFAFRGAGIVQSLATRLSMVDPTLAYLVYGAALVPFYVLGYVLFAAPFKGKTLEGVGSRSILLLLVGMLMCVNIFKYLFDIYGDGELSNMFVLFSLFDLITCVFLLALLREVVDRASALRTNEILERLIYQQKDQVESSKETIDLINVKAHDLKQQLSMLSGRVEPQEIADMKKLVNVYDATVHTGNDALDVILAQKMLICEQRGIRFDRIVDGAALGFMTASDIYSLFGNAMDNALEALNNPAFTRDATADRYISLHVRVKKGLLSIHMENPYRGEIHFGTNGLPETIKEDHRYHGFGMNSMQMICDRYHGWLSVRTVKNVFELNILLPL